MAEGDTSFVIKATDKTKAAFASVEGGLKGIASKVFSLQGAIAGLAGAAGFGALIASASKLADSTAKAADRLNISTQSLTGMQYAADLAGYPPINSMATSPRWRKTLVRPPLKAAIWRWC